MVEKLEKPADESSQEDKDQEALGAAILASKPDASTETKEEAAEEKPGDKSEEKAEEKAEEKKEEKVEEKEKAPESKVPQSEDEKEIAKILEQFKGDSKEVAKGYQNVRKLADRLGIEVGEKRKIEDELSTLKKRMEDDPEAVAKELLTKKQMGEGNLLDQAIENPDVLPTYIQSEIKKGIASFVDGQKLETALEEQYPGYKDSAKKIQVEELDRLIKAGKIPLKEVLVWATDGYKQPEKIAEITKVLKEELDGAKATKLGETVDKQGVVTSEKEEPDLDDMDVKQKLLGEAILKSRPH